MLEFRSISFSFVIIFGLFIRNIKKNKSSFSRFSNNVLRFRWESMMLGATTL